MGQWEGEEVVTSDKKEVEEDGDGDGCVVGGGWSEVSVPLLS